MANRIATILGIGFLLVGIAGFVSPDILGLHLSLYHNIIHLVTGAVSLWLGLKGSVRAAKTFCLVFGAVYVLLGIAGFVAGDGEMRMLVLLPGQLEFGTVDHIVHIVLGALYLIGGLMTPSIPIPPPRPS